MPRLRALLLALAALSVAAFAAAQEASYTLQVIHASDNESAFQDPNTLEERVLGYASVIEGLRELSSDGSIYVTAGDHTLPGPFYAAAEQVDALGAPGLGDIALFNGMGLDANGIGNHEFDGGLDDFARMLAHAEYPFIAVNLDFSDAETGEDVPPIEMGTDGASVEENAGKIVRSAYVEVGGERIGLIGRAPADFFNVIEDPDETMPGVDFYGGRDPENNQPLESAVPKVLEQVDLLQRQGIDKIVLLDHAQDFTADPLGTEALYGIDVIVQAGATGFMARPEAEGPFNLLREGDEAQTIYPTLRLDRDGGLVAVVNSDQLYRYVGQLRIGFDDQGRIVHVDRRSGPIASSPEGVSALEAYLEQDLAPPRAVTRTFEALQDTDIIQEAFEVVGTTEVALNGERVNVRGRATNLGRLASDSTLWYARRAFEDRDVDLALKNGGGIRASITGPNVTRLAINTALAFNNQISVVELSATELLATMENAVSRVPAADGRFPQLAGAHLVYDPDRPGVSDEPSMDTPSRVRTLRIVDDGEVVDTVVEDGRLQGDPDRTFELATNSFLATGGDGYASLAAAAEARPSVITDIGEQEVLVEYLQEVLDGNVNLPDPPENPRVAPVGE
ncbi:MAG: 5'-nucleotidase C-terminal domain-containing protein [Trueperaceae bacterium]|nr:5'-nucleotidase C-terminal domain-containing protein [Trueperaceae bacterium]